MICSWQVVRGEGLDHVGQRTGLGGTLDQVLLAERGQQDDGSDVVLGQLLGCGDAVELGHLDVHHDEVGTQVGRELDGGLAVSGFTDDVEPVVAEDLHDVEADERLVLGDDDATGCWCCCFCVTHGRKPTRRRNCRIPDHADRSDGWAAWYEWRDAGPNCPARREQFRTSGGT